MIFKHLFDSTSQNEPGINDYKRVLHTFLELEPYHQMKFTVIPRTSLFSPQGWGCGSAGDTVMYILRN